MKLGIVGFIEKCQLLRDGVKKKENGGIAFLALTPMNDKNHSSLKTGSMN